jgi:hypothetical protein
MTRVILNGTIKGLRGKLGNLIFRQMPDGTTVVTEAKPKKNSRQKKRAKARRSAKQKAHNERFTDASFYGKVHQTDPVYVQLAEVTPMHNAYNFAVSDWWHAPEIHRVERRGRHIRVEATDNIQVTRVRVTILDEADKVLEKGEATRTRGNWWRFTPQAKGGTIIAEAWDLPKNVTKFVLK